MCKNKFNLRNVAAVTIFLTGMIALSSCDKDNDISYPYTEHELWFVGSKSGLTSSSSEAAFRNGLTEVLQTWSKNNPSTNEIIFDGITYELTNIQEATGAIPKSLWEVFWKNLNEYSYSIGSCWGFTEAKISSKGAIGTAYIIYTIVTQENLGSGGSVLYVGLKCNLTPKSPSNTRSAEIYQLDNAEKINNLLKTAKVKRQNN